MPPESSLFVGDAEYDQFSSPAPESSISAAEQPRSQRPIVSAPSPSTSSASTRQSQPKKRKLRAPETWKHFRVPQGRDTPEQPATLVLSSMSQSAMANSL